MKRTNDHDVTDESRCESGSSRISYQKGIDRTTKRMVMSHGMGAVLVLGVPLTRTAVKERRPLDAVSSPSTQAVVPHLHPKDKPAP
jgi:hypothetical protein